MLLIRFVPADLPFAGCHVKASYNSGAATSHELRFSMEKCPPLPSEIMSPDIAWCLLGRRQEAICDSIAVNPTSNKLGGNVA